MTRPARQHGFTLLEALVALVVISIGLLGLLGLQTVAIVNTHVSRSQTLASIGADDIADRIRANPAATAAAVYDAVDNSAAATPSTNCSQTICTPAQMAQYDVSEWKQTLATTLPDGQGQISCASPTSPSASSPCRVYEVTVSWRGRDNAAGSGNADAAANCPTGADEAADRCYAIEVQP